MTRSCCHTSQGPKSSPASVVSVSRTWCLQAASKQRFPFGLCGVYWSLCFLPSYQHFLHMEYMHVLHLWSASGTVQLVWWLCYGLHDLGFDYWLGQEIFLFPKRSRPVVWRIQPPFNWYQGSFPGGQSISDFHLMMRLRINGAVPLLPLYAFMAQTKITLPNLHILSELYAGNTLMPITIILWYMSDASLLGCETVSLVVYFAMFQGITVTSLHLHSYAVQQRMACLTLKMKATTHLTTQHHMP